MIGRGYGSRRLRRRARSGTRPRLEALEGRQLLTTYTVTNTGDLTPTGAVVPGSLRDMIIQANANPGSDSIKFNIPGSGVQTIRMSGVMPAITDSLTIDGSTQPGFAGPPLVALDGTNAGTSANGLRIDAGATTIKNLDINSFKAAGIRIDVSGATIQGCFIGTDANGSAAKGNGGAGIDIESSSNNQIGGPNSGDGNTISGNLGDGILINTSASTGNTIQGNLIGLNSSGTLGVGNGGNGINVFGGAFNQIGGQLANEGNTISGNAADGISLLGVDTKGNSIQGNFIGTNVFGVAAIGNQGDGIGVTGASVNVIGGTNTGLPATVLGAHNVISGNTNAGIGIVGGDQLQILGNLIGTDVTGTAAVGNLGAGVADNGGNDLQVGGSITGAGNVIAFNGNTAKSGGVNIFAGTGVSILSNSIFSNSGLGIVRSAFTDFPTLTLAATGAGRTKIQGVEAATPDTQYLVQFFANDAADPSGFGQGQTFIGSTTVTTDGSGTAVIDVTLPTPVQVGQFVTATVTDPANNTSEFSGDQQVAKAALANLSVTLTASPSPATLGGNLTYSLTVTNNGPDSAADVVLNDVLPTSVTFVSATSDHGTPTQNGNTVIVPIGNLRKSDTANITITVTPNQTGTITDNASVSSSAIDPDPTTDTTSVNTDVNIPADLSVAISGPGGASLDSVTIGNNLTYVVIVTNSGPGAATGVTLTDVLPSTVSIVSANTGQGTILQVGNTLTTSMGTLATGVSAALRIVVTPDSTGKLVHTATVTGDEIDPNPTNNSAEADTQVNPASDLAVTLTSSPQNVLDGQNLTYTATIKNNGPSDATNVTLTDQLPASVTFVSANGNTTAPTGGLVSVNVGTILHGDSATVTIIVQPSGTGQLSNTVNVSSDEIDPVETNNSATVTNLVNPADLSVTIATSPPVVFSNLPLTYIVTVTNLGPATATNATLTETLPAGLSLVSSPAVTTGVVTQNSGGTVVVNFGSLAFTASATLTLVVMPTASASLVDTAKVTADQVDPNTDNNTTSVTNIVNPVDLSVSLSGAGGPVAFGDNVSYTAIVVNNGPTTAHNVNLSLTLPAGVNFVSGTTTLGQVAQFGGTVIAAIGDVPLGGTAIVTVTLAPTVAGSFSTTATVGSTDVDSNTSNNSSTVNTDVINLPGLLQFSQPVFSVKENAGVATITVVRTGGTLGTIAVNFAATAGTAADGVNFHAVSGTLVFNDGVKSQTFQVPLIDDGVEDADHTVKLTLSDAGGSPIGPRSTATLVVQNADIDLVGPRVSDVQLLGSGRAVDGIVVTLTKPLDPTRAMNAANYFIAAPGSRANRGGGSIPIASVSYTPGGRTLLITPAKPLRLGVFYEFEINGSTAGGVTDQFGNLLNSNGVTGVAPSSFIETIARGSSLTYIDRGNNTVNIRLTGGGVIDLTRGPDGEGQIMRLIGTVPGRSTLSGSVRKRSLHSSGVTTLQTIEGLGEFGAVRSLLHTPPFVVTQVLVPASVTSAAVPSSHLFARRALRKFH
jgi:uncharacterized repeat protein (TIGR01451 family)